MTRSEWCVDMVSCVEERPERFWWLQHLQWGHRPFLQRITSSDRLTEDAERFLYKVLVSAYTVSLARETQLLSHCLKVSVESGGVQKAGFMNDWSVVLWKRHLTESSQIFINVQVTHGIQILNIAIIINIHFQMGKMIFSYFCVLSSWLFFMAKISTAKNMSESRWKQSTPTV